MTAPAASSSSVFSKSAKAVAFPAPGVNVRIGPFLADFVWPAERLIVETDGYQYHRGRAAFEADRKRDLELRALGYDVIRLTYRQVTDRPAETASAIRVAIATRSQSQRAWRESRTYSD
jgi:very-short-patch-repair endonuclease